MNAMNFLTSRQPTADSGQCHRLTANGLNVSTSQRQSSDRWSVTGDQCQSFPSSIPPFSRSPLLPFSILLLACALLLAGTVSAQTRIVINADLGRDTISRYIYGTFSEHLGHCIYGGFYVGEGNTKIPNTRGIRNDIVKAFREINLPLLRWPGGCFADIYHWRDGIGPKDKRPPMVNVWWGNTIEDNSFGTDEFMDLCQQIGCDPYFAGNVGSGSVEELAEWVQYLNGPENGPMGKLRAAFGHPKPYNVRFWGVGNESWGCGGSMNVEYYANLYKRYATFMANIFAPSGLYRVASGPGGDDYHWTEVMMRDVNPGLMEGLSLHHYAVIDWGHKGSATEFSEKQYFTTMQRALQMEEYVTKHTTIMDRYDPQDRVGLVVDEWGGWYDVEPGTNPGFLFQQNTMRDAMLAGVTLNIFNNHCARVKAAAVAQAVNVLQSLALTQNEKLVLTPTYWVFDLYKEHHDALMLPVDVKSAKYSLDGASLPAVSASASRSKDGVIHISLVNIDADHAQDVTIDLHGATPSKVSGQILVSKKIQDYNSFDDPGKIKPAEFNGAKLTGGTIQVQMPAAAVVVLDLQTHP